MKWLSCIKTSGAQYIDTGFKANQDTRVLIAAEFTGNLATVALFGGRNSTSEKTFTFWWHVSSYSSARYDYYTNNSALGFELERNKKFKIDADGSIISVGSTFAYMNYLEFQCDYNLFIGAVNTAGVAKNFFTGNIYYCKIYDGNNLIRDYVPAENDNGEVGMYDRVNGVFYGDAAGLGFAAGEYHGTVDMKIIGLTNDKTYYVRVFPINHEECAQSEIAGQLATAMTSSFPAEEPTSYNLLETVTTSRTWTAPADGWYRIEVQGASGSGASSSGRQNIVYGSEDDPKKQPVYISGGGGGGGGASVSIVKLKKGDTIVLTCGAIGEDSSAIISSSIEAYDVMTVTSGKTPADAAVWDRSIYDWSAPSGDGGEASGGNVGNYNGENGKSGNRTITSSERAYGGTGGKAGLAEGNPGGTGAGGMAAYNSEDHQYNTETAKTLGQAGFVKIYSGNTNKVA